MDIETVLFYVLMLHGILYLAQTPFYGFQENNRPTFLMGLLFFLFAWMLPKGENWVNWAVLILPATSFIALFSSFSESLKPSWLKYAMMFLNLLLVIGAVFYFLA